MRYYFIICTDKARFVHFLKHFIWAHGIKFVPLPRIIRKMLLVSSSIKRLYYNFISYEIKNRSTCQASTRHKKCG